MKLRTETSPTGLTVWALPGTSLEIMWAGPGSRLLIGRPRVAGGIVTHIDHPTARDAYDTRKAADAAVRAFVAASETGAE